MDWFIWDCGCPYMGRPCWSWPCGDATDAGELDWGVW